MTNIITGIESPPRFALHELAFLLSGRTDATADMSRRVFGIPEARSEQESLVFGTGQSSLVARGLIGDEGGTMVPRAEARLVGFGLGLATLWASVAVRTPAGSDVVVFVGGEKIGFMVRGAPASTLDFVPVRPDLSTASVALDGIAGQLDTAEANAGAQFDMMLRVATLDREGALFVQRGPEGWLLGENPVFPGDENWPAPDLELVPASRGDVDSAIAELIGTA